MALSPKTHRPGQASRVVTWNWADQWHVRGLRVLNVAPGLARDERANRSMEAAVRLLEAGVGDQRPLVTHRYTVEEAAHAMAESVERPKGYIKGILDFHT